MTLKENEQIKDLVRNEFKKKDKVNNDILNVCLIGIVSLSLMINTWLSAVALLKICEHLGVI